MSTVATVSSPSAAAVSSPQEALDYLEKKVVPYSTKVSAGRWRTIPLSIAALADLQFDSPEEHQALSPFDFFINPTWDKWQLAAALNLAGCKVPEEASAWSNNCFVAVPRYLEDVPLWSAAKEKAVFIEQSRGKRCPFDLPRRLVYIPPDRRPREALWTSWRSYVARLLALKIALHRLPEELIAIITDSVLAPFHDPTVHPPVAFS